MNSSREVAEVLELAASVRPGLLEPLAVVLSRTTAGRKLAADWRVEPEALAQTVEVSIGRLNFLERRRWKAESALGGNVHAVCDLAIARAGRVPVTRGRRLERVIRKLADRAELERIRGWLESFLAESGGDQVARHV